MKRTTLTIFAFILVAIAGGAVWYLVHTSREARGPNPGGTASSTDTALTGKALYSNGEFGFLVQYPDTADVQDSFSTYYHLPNYWRANALSNATGTPIVAIATYRTESDHSYPRYFDAEVRIGASSDPKEIAQCLKVTPNQGEVALPDVVIGSTTFKVFSFESAGMMQYLKGVSYRTMHDGRCVALEKIQTGSAYRDDPKSADDISDTVLQEKYAELDAIIQSFSFAHP